jgi:unsaturated rhamnogalacturonyl hydrolase
MVDSVMRRRPAVVNPRSYESGPLFKAIAQVWQDTQDEKYYAYIKGNVDSILGPGGMITAYRMEEYNLDNINIGKTFLFLYTKCGDEKYKQAAHHLRRQLYTHPRVSQGGFWHKQIYPHQMWLDGIYMASPFYAEFAGLFNESDGFDDVATQILLIDEHARDPKTGLRYHAWDASKNQRWANPDTGCSPHFWGRAMGWYAMALVDLLEYFPATHPKRPRILDILEDVAEAVSSVQDSNSGLWYQILDQGNRDGNYWEASASCMFVYALARGVNEGYLDKRYLAVAQQGHAGIIEHLIDVDEQEFVNLHGICSVAGLGGDPYRDGSFAYYVGEKVVSNEDKGIGAFILASVEIERMKA